MLLKCGTITYWTTDMRGLVSVAQTSQTSALSQATICPISGPIAGVEGGWRGDKNAVEMRDDRILDRRHARTILRCSDASDLCLLPGDDTSRVCPPTGGEGSCKGILHAVETQHNRRGRKTCADCSPLLRCLGPLSSHRCPSQLPNSPSITSPQMP